MSETADKALELADKWGSAIAAKISAAAPGAADVALEAVVVKAGGEVLSWVLYAIMSAILMACTFKFMRAYAVASEGKRSGEVDNDNGPAFAGSLVFGLICACTIVFGVIGNFPSRELVGLFAPRGYVALMVLDAVKK